MNLHFFSILSGNDFFFSSITNPAKILFHRIHFAQIHRTFCDKLNIKHGGRIQSTIMRNKSQESTETYWEKAIARQFHNKSGLSGDIVTTRTGFDWEPSRFPKWRKTSSHDRKDVPIPIYLLNFCSITLGLVVDV